MAKELEGFLPALQQLDLLLEAATNSAASVYGSEAASDPYRGLYINPSDVERAFARKTATSPFESEPDAVLKALTAAMQECPTLLRLQRSFHLSAFEMGLVLMALAPEIDLRYERIYAYLQDDVTRRYPTVELALNLFGSSPSTKLVNRNSFAADAPLMRQGLLRLVPDPNQVHPPLLSHYLKLDDQVIHFLLGETSLDSRLKPFSQLLQPVASLEQVLLEQTTKQAVLNLINYAQQAQHPLQLYFHGSPGVGKQTMAAAIAAHLGTTLLVVDLVTALNLKVDLEPTLKLLQREACCQNALLYFSRFDQLAHHELSNIQVLMMAIVSHETGLVILAGSKPWLPPMPFGQYWVDVHFPVPDFNQRQRYWQTKLAEANISLDSNSIHALSNRFRLTATQMEAAIALAKNHALWSAAIHSTYLAQATQQTTLNELFAAARMQSDQVLSDLAKKVSLKYTWNDIVLPVDQMAQLNEICNQVKHRYVVYGQWGFDRKLSLGKGVNVLFSGPPGTGKTMAAEVIANELQLDLYKIDLSQIVSKYIGETEKNLDRIFTAAQTANAILFFDEADALFGKRSEVKDAHDRYANIEVGYLLQKMEEYEGLAILASNLRQNLDDAFVRRLHFIVEFPFPDEVHRCRIWEVLFPEAAPLDRDVDFSHLAQDIKLAGGNLKNIALSAAFYAASDGEMIQMRHLIQAAQREHQKIGQNWQTSIVSDPK